MKRGNPWPKYLGAALVLYMMFSVGKLAYKNYQLNIHELKLKEEITILENEIQDLNNKIIYYQSEPYKDKMIRDKLLMQKEGEKVVVVTPEPKIEEEETTKESKKLTNPEKWWAYFIGI